MEAALRFGIFVAIFVAVAAAEWRAPRQLPTRTRRERWRVNLGIIALDVVLQRATVGAAAFAAALYARDHGFGLFNVVDLPAGVEIVLAFLALDLAVYLQHVASHAVPVLWRIHAVHHADLDVDLTTGLRFHPLEIGFSLAWKAAVVAALGADPWAVVAFEAVLNASAVFTHGNIRLPERVDGVLRRLFCTPDMHRVHHSVVPAETHSNFGFFLSVWDRLFRTYRTAPHAGWDGLVLGLPDERDPARLGLAGLLAMPFRRRPAGDAGRS